ncbi:hypothetical protein [Oricola thermophila]|uniref:Uncharacterized protein n=1 Tax=Oricola thermophila TaxID=2742145 RepID=A0A6N1VHY3_9HYPH|nr:hypothetical protein [Oricola thermophila]QKV19325.1 hypothetical protein HTY61_13085 [Oricola thermophila]
MRLVSRKFAAALVAAALGAGPAAAADAGRYVMEKTDEGYVRMDTATGEMSICTEKGGQLVCKLAADERAAFQDALDRLEERVSRLEDRVGRTLAVPSDEEFEQGLDNMEKFFRRFLGIVEEFEDERSAPEAPEPREPLPDRT